MKTPNKLLGMCGILVIATFDVVSADPVTKQWRTTPPPPFQVQGGTTCADAKKLYEEQKCDSAHSHNLETSAVSYVANPKTTFVLSDAQSVSCDLPVNIHWAVTVNKTAYLMSYPESLLKYMQINRWGMSGVGIATGAMTYSGLSFSEFAQDGKPFDPSNPTSVPLRLYLQQHFVNSEVTYKYYTALLNNWATGYFDKGKFMSAALVMNLKDVAKSSIAVNGMCKRHADSMKKTLEEFYSASLKRKNIKYYSPYPVWDFTFQSSMTLARPSTPLNSNVPIISLRTSDELNAVGIRPQGWASPILPSV
jgi:hypothetical protein